MSLPDGLREQIAGKRDEELYSYFSSAGDYTTETLDAVRSEIRRRGLPEEQLDELAAMAVADTKLQQARRGVQPRSIKGFGTRLLGECDYATDGSYRTTVWITALYWPLIPLRSVRIRPGAGEKPEIVALCPLDWGQVARTYLFVALLTASISGAEKLGRHYLPTIDSAVFILAGAALPFLWLIRERRRARRKHRRRAGS